MVFFSQYLMLLHKGWFVPIIFFNALVEENETPRCLESCCLPRLGWFEWKSWNFLKNCHGQPKLCFSLGLNGDIFLLLHLWSWLLNLSLFPLPISSCLLSPFLRLQVLEKILAHVFLKFQTLMEERSPLGNQDTNHNPRDVKMSNLSTCPSYTLCYMSLDLSIFWRALESQIWHPSKKTQNGNTYSG